MQTMLGRSRDGALVVVYPLSPGEPHVTAVESTVGKPLLYRTDDQRVPAEITVQGGPITRLPNEILLNCFELLVIDAPYKTRYPVLLTLMLTCQRFHDLARPLLYSDLRLYVYDDEMRPERSTYRLNRSLELHPGLKDCCKSLSINFSGSERSFGYTLSTIQSFPNVKKLKLNRITGSRKIRDGNTGAESTEFEQDDEILPPPGKEGSASFTELTITNFMRGSPTALRNFLKWPAKLEIFNIDELAMGDYTWDCLIEMGCNRFVWTYELLKTTLSSHKHSLKQLSIGQMGPQTGLEKFDLNDFISLEVLDVCFSGCEGLPPSAVCHNWVTGSLKRLVLNCSYYDSQHGIVWFFKEDTRDWVKEFATAAAERKKADGSGLREISLVWMPEFDDPTEDRSLDEAKQHICDLGFDST